MATKTNTKSKSKPESNRQVEVILRENEKGFDAKQLLMELYNNLSGQIFQLNEAGGNYQAWIITSCPEDVLTKLWGKFYFHSNDVGDNENGEPTTYEDEIRFGDLEVKPDGVDWIDTGDVDLFAKFLRKLGYAAVSLARKEIELP